MEGAGILLAATPQCPLVIDVTKLKINHYQSSKFEIPPLPAFEKLNLVGEGFPFGMCFFVRESKLYMVGEKLRLRFTVDLDESFGERGFSRDIYVTDLTEPDSITNFQNQVPLLQRLKVRFTCCQVLLGTWTVYFPHPLGTTIYVVAADYGGENYFSYCVNDKEWKLPVPLLPLFSGKFVPAYNDIFIYFYWDSLFAAWIPSVGSPICYQALKEVSEDYFLRDMVSESGVVLDLGEHEMCIMNPGLLLEADPSLEELQSEDLLSDDPIPGRTTL
ncbi:hypothetical protein AAG906_029116 [Vitis piasezkii]